MNREPTEQFVSELTGNQTRLLAFVLSLLPDREAARDVLQATNLLLWQKAGEYTPGTNFMGWACQVARLKVLSHLRDMGREQLVFDAALVEDIAQSAQHQAEESSQLRRYLDDCLDRQGPEARKLVLARYEADASVNELSRRTGVAPGTLSMKLCRIRKALQECIERKIALEARP
ncbi:MAG: sigma-70 family RNA polymerase sigma factor [Planctomycetia bacterium]|nr:sigma-70 family RNA polymerase sigma factor [Planctomycetia bacterium]